jgi:glutathione S-transferase
LHYAPHTCALASHIALEQVGAHYQAHRLDFAAREQRSAGYLRLNPLGRVPALETERGVLTETPAIFLYNAQTYPDAAVAPLDDAYALAQMNAFNSYLCSTVHVAHAHRMRGARWTDDPAAIVALQKKVPQNMRDGFELIETSFFKGPWVLGERYSVSDMYLYALATWLEGDGVDPNEFPKVADHSRRMSEWPAVQRVLAQHARAA